MKTIQKHQVEKARRRYSQYIEFRAGEAEDQVGFGYVVQGEAPSTYKDLCAAYAHSEKTGEPLAVLRENAYAVGTAQKHTWMARYWHDTRHVRTGLGFNLVDEMTLAQQQSAEMVKFGFGADSLEVALFQADLFGSSTYYGVAKSYVQNQLLFVLRALQCGMAYACIAERDGAPPTEFISDGRFTFDFDIEEYAGGHPYED